MRIPLWFALVAGLGVLGGAAALADDPPAAPTPAPAPAPTPAAPTPALAAQGKALYGQLCRNCHGVNMVNAGTSSFDLRTFPHDDRDRFVNSVTHGKNSMPAWGDILKPEEIDALWAYILTGGKT